MQAIKLKTFKTKNFDHNYTLLCSLERVLLLLRRGTAFAVLLWLDLLLLLGRGALALLLEFISQTLDFSCSWKLWLLRLLIEM